MTLRRRGHLGPERFLSFHPDAIAAAEADQLRAGVVGAQHDWPDAAGHRLGARGRGGTGAVGEQRRGARSDVDEARQEVGADHERVLPGPDSIWPQAIASTESQPVQAAPTSTGPARSAPISPATSGAAFGVMSSAVDVATSTRSTSPASIPACARAVRPASAANPAQALPVRGPGAAPGCRCAG